MYNKRIYKSRNDKMISGVCGGIGEYMNIDPQVVRLITLIVGAFALPMSIIVYILAGYMLKYEDEVY